MKILPIGSYYLTNQHGCVQNTSANKLPLKWEKGLTAIIKEYNRHLEKKIHSIYLRGSVANGKPIDGISDFDTFALVKGNITNTDRKWIPNAEKKLRKRFPFATKFEILLYSYRDFLNLEKFYTARFLLKASGRCIYGKDISKKIKKIKLATYIKKIRKNNVILTSIDKTIFQLKNTASPTIRKEICQWITKRILRTIPYITFETEKQFTRDLFPCYALGVKCFSKQKQKIRQLLNWAVNPTPNKKRLIPFLVHFRKWLARQLK